MDKEDRKLQKYLVDEMMKVSKTNPDVMIYMQALMEKYEDLQQRINKAIESIEDCKKVNGDEKTCIIDYNYLLDILKGDDTDD